MKLLVTVFLLLSISGADDDRGKEYKHGKKENRYELKGVAPVTNTLYRDECGSCHFAYQPGLLPSASWQKMMGELDNHFGVDASLAKDEVVTLSSYLERNSAENAMQYKRSRKTVEDLRGTTPNAITEIRYFIDEHKDIRENLLTQKEVKGLFNCTACHTKAESGSYDDDEIIIPNYGRWED